MNTSSISLNAPLSALAIAAGMLLSSQARAEDYKHFNAAAVCAPYTASAPDYATLRFRAEGIINDSDASKFVICNVPRDSEAAWASSGSWGMAAFFRRTTSGTPAITSNQCTLSVGFNLSEPLQSKTYSAEPVSSTYGYISMENDTPSGDLNSYGTLVCRIAPGSLMDLIVMAEYIPTSN